jgi:DnaJ-domain-containing protein 1
MGIVNRFFNIVKTNLKNNSYFHNDTEHFTEAQINDLLNDDTDEELKKIIDGLNNKTNNINFSVEVRNAFRTLGISETTDINIITAAFKQKIMQYHPDKNTNVSAEEYKQLVSKSTNIINAYNTIKNFFTTTTGMS